jgi:hypothetical protein
VISAAQNAAQPARRIGFVAPGELLVEGQQPWRPFRLWRARSRPHVRHEAPSHVALREPFPSGPVGTRSAGHQALPSQA